MPDILSIAQSLGERVHLLLAFTPTDRAVLRPQVEAADLVECCGIEPSLSVEARNIQKLVANLFDGPDFTETSAAIHQALRQFAAKV